LPERHLGLVQAQEHPELEAFLDAAANICEDHLDLGGISNLAHNIVTPDVELHQLPSPLGQRISVAKDIAFAFSYVHLLDHWRRMGAEISFFSPLANEAPRSDADAIYLPGGYPELHAGKLTEAQTFLSGVQAAAENGALIYGECGGYMILGDGLVDADGCRHKMLGILATGNVVPNPQTAPRLSEGHLKNRCAMVRLAGSTRVSLCQCCE
jgi:cobyrinic acid a,c-diamide synthase